MNERPRKVFEAAAARALEHRAEARATVTPLVVAVNRFIEGWAEADYEVRRSLWTKMAMANDEVAEAYLVYPLDSEEVAEERDD